MQYVNNQYEHGEAEDFPSNIMEDSVNDEDIKENEVFRDMISTEYDRYDGFFRNNLKTNIVVDMEPKNNSAEIYKKISIKKSPFGGNSMIGEGPKIEIVKGTSLTENNFKEMDCVTSTMEDSRFNSTGDAEYIIDTRGRLSIVGSGKNATLTWLCNYDFEVTKYISKDEGLNLKTGEEYNSETRLILKIKPEKRLQPQMGTSFLFSVDNTKKIGETITKSLPELYMNPNASRAEANLCAYAAMQMVNASREVYASHVGWRGHNGNYAYLHGGGAIGFCNEPVIANTDKFIEVENTLMPKDAFLDFLGLLKIGKTLDVILPLALYNIMSLLTTLFILAGYPPNFILWILGPTGSLKTTVAKLVFNTFNVSQGIISASLRDTKVGHELKAFEFKDSTLLVDDVHPTESPAELKSQQDKLSSLTRAYGDRIPKIRGTSDIKLQQTYPPRGCCAITGEIQIGNRSDNARCIIVEVDKNSYDTEVLTKFQENPKVITTNSFFFLRWVSNHFAQIVRKIQIEFPKFRTQFTNDFGHKRLADSFIMLSIVADIVLEYGVSVTAVSIEQANQMKADWVKILLSTTNQSEVYVESQEPGTMYLSVLCEMISSGEYVIPNISEAPKKGCRNVIGYEDAEFYYLFPSITYERIKTHYSRQGKVFPVEKAKVHEALDELGVLKVKIGTRNGREIRLRTFKKFINQELRVNMLHISKMKIHDIISDGL